MKTLEYYKNLEYRLIIERINFEGEVYFNCYSEELGKYSCFGQGDTAEEAVNNFYAEKDDFIESLYANNLSIPEPENYQEVLLSGVFNLRMDPATHSMLAIRAKKSRLSLNQYVNKLIDRNLSAEIVAENIRPMFDEMKELITTHDCNVKQQFRNFWLNMGLKRLATSINDDWTGLYAGQHEYEEIAA